MRVKARTHKIGIALYALPFLAVIVLSLFFVWPGDLEMVVTAIALLPAALYFFGVRWCRYIVGMIAAIGFLASSLRAIPALTMDPGSYFWLIWSPLWLIFAFSAFVSFIPPCRREKNDGSGL